MAATDYNLLRPLRALLEERNVTRAAERLHVSQSAMSIALAKLRRHYGDPLLVRRGNRHDLTPLAERLLARPASRDRRDGAGLSAAVPVRSGDEHPVVRDRRHRLHDRAHRARTDPHRRAGGAERAVRVPRRRRGAGERPPRFTPDHRRRDPAARIRHRSAAPRPRHRSSGCASSTRRPASATDRPPTSC